MNNTNTTTTTTHQERIVKLCLQNKRILGFYKKLSFWIKFCTLNLWKIIVLAATLVWCVYFSKRLGFVSCMLLIDYWLLFHVSVGMWIWYVKKCSKMANCECVLVCWSLNWTTTESNFPAYRQSCRNQQGFSLSIQLVDFIHQKVINPHYIWQTTQTRDEQV